MDKSLREAGLLKGKTKLPKLGTVLDAREKDIKIVEEKKEKRKKDKRTIYISTKDSQITGAKLLCTSQQTN